MALSDIETRLIELGLIPWDKSFTIRMGYMDFFLGKTSIFKFLEKEKDNLSGDLLSLWQLMIAWKEGKPMKTESATTLRFFIYPSWMAQDHRVFIKQGSLINRQITDDPRKVIYQPTSKLILLDGGTSQWASAAYLYYWSIKRPWAKINNPPPKLQSTYDDVEYYDRLKWREMGEVTIGLVSDEMAKIWKKREVGRCEDRKKILEDWIKKIGKEAKIIGLNDKFGPTLKEDFDYIVVSPETYDTAVLINRERQRLDKKSMEIVKIEFVLAQDGKPISSTRIFNGEIDGEGRTLK